MMDTEAFVHLLERSVEEFLQMLNKFFCFSILDIEELID